MSKKQYAFLKLAGFLIAFTTLTCEGAKHFTQNSDDIINYESDNPNHPPAPDHTNTYVL